MARFAGIDSQIPELNSQRAQRSETFEISSDIEISSENEIFERATHRGPIFGGRSRRDQKVRARFIFV